MDALWQNVANAIDEHIADFSRGGGLTDYAQCLDFRVHG